VTPLTKREREVAELVAAGLTSRQIADRLFIGVRTAEFHVDQLRNKLGVRSRAEIAAAWVQQRAAADASPNGEVSELPAAVPARRRSAGRRWPRVGAALAVAVLGAATVVGVIVTWPHIQGAQPGQTIVSLAGTGTAGFSGDGGPARQAALREPNGIALDADGGVYVAAEGRIRHIGRDGVISTVAGAGGLGSSEDGGAATIADLDTGGKWGNTGLAVDRDGAIYVPDGRHHRVRKVTGDGIITTIAGTGRAGGSGDGGPARAAQLDLPRGVAIDSRGVVFIAEAGGHRVRRVDPGGIISTYAGTGDPGAAGDGGPAVAAQLNGPEALALDRAGNLFIADTLNNRIRRVALDGTITTVAGSGAFGFAGDGGPATRARLGLPRGLASDPRGHIYIADSDNNRIRRVDAAGIITTVAGTGRAGYSGDGQSPLRAQLDEPDGVAVDGRGRVYIADAGNHRVRILQ
jgi:DNA-binding CsgD family transcriptional regulator/sugar lactone lactonase YvrE